MGKRPAGCTNSTVHDKIRPHCNILTGMRVKRAITNNWTMTTNEVLMPIAILGSFGASLYYFTRVMTDYILKKKMIEKGYVNEDTQSIFRSQDQTENKYASLKWGLILFFGGLSFVLMEFIPTYGNSPLPFGLFFVSVSIGFLIYFFVVKRESK